MKYGHNNQFFLILVFLIYYFLPDSRSKIYLRTIESKALNDIDKYINMYPEKNIFKEYRKSLIGFDRNEFINSYGIQEK